MAQYGGVVAQKEVWWLIGGVVAQLVSATGHWVTQSSLGFEYRLEPHTEGTLRGGRKLLKQINYRYSNLLFVI